MGFVREYATQAPERSAVEAQTGLQVLNSVATGAATALPHNRCCKSCWADTKRSTTARSKMEKGGR